MALYTDINANYMVDSNVLILEDEDAVNGELENCLGIQVLEMWWEPTVGSSLRHYLFEQVDEVTASLIWMEVLDRVPIWMPHITLMQGTGVYTDYDEQQYTVVICYRINGTRIDGSYTGVLKAGI